MKTGLIYSLRNDISLCFPLIFLHITSRLANSLTLVTYGMEFNVSYYLEGLPQGAKNVMDFYNSADLLGEFKRQCLI